MTINIICLLFIIYGANTDPEEGLEKDNTKVRSMPMQLYDKIHKKLDTEKHFAGTEVVQSQLI